LTLAESVKVMAEERRPLGGFVPAGPKKVETRVFREGDTMPATERERMATALEYIAAQLGQLNQKLDKLIARIERE
jgi:hypothetical protein